MERKASLCGKCGEKLTHQFCVERADFLRGHLDIPNQIGPPGYVQSCTNQRVIHRQQAIAVAADALLVAHGLRQRLTERDAGVLNRVVIVDMQIALRAGFHVNQRVAGQLVEHMIKEADAGLIVVRTGSIKVDLNDDVGFCRFARDGCAAHGVLPLGFDFKALIGRSGGEAKSGLATKMARVVLGFPPRGKPPNVRPKVMGESMERKDRIDGQGALILIAFSMALGLNQALVKIMNDALQPVFQAGLRSVVAIIPVLLISLYFKRRLSISDGSLIPGILTGCCFAAEFVLLFLALEYTSVARASIFFYTMPFWLAVAAHFLIPGERLTIWRVLGLGLAVVGVSIALGGGGDLGPKALLGDVMCLIGAMFWAVIALMARKTKLANSCPEMQLLYQLVVSGIILVPFSLLFGDWVREFTPVYGAIFAFQCFGIVGVGFLTWFWVLKRYPASDMASFGFLAPVFGVIFGWLLLEEAITWDIVLAMALVAVGIYLVNARFAKAKTPA